MRVSPRLSLLIAVTVAVGAAPASAQSRRHHSHRRTHHRRHTAKPAPPPAPSTDHGAADQGTATQGAGDSGDHATSSAPAAGSAAAAPTSGAAAAPAAGAAAATHGSQPSPSSTGTAAASDQATDIDTLRKEYLSLRDELFRSRARAAAVASALYSSRMQVQLDYGSGRFYTVTRATVRLDGANVFDDSQGQIAQDHAPRFDGFVAPGRHVVAVRIEATGKDDQRFTSASETSFVVEVPGKREVVVKCKASDQGDIAYQWQRNQKGSYKLHLDVSVETHKLEAGGGGK